MSANDLELVPPRIPLTDPQTGLIEKAWDDLIRALFMRAGGANAMSISDLETLVTLTGSDAAVAELAKRLAEVEAQANAAASLQAQVAELSKRLSDLEVQAGPDMTAVIADHTQHLANITSQGTVKP